MTMISSLNNLAHDKHSHSSTTSISSRFYVCHSITITLHCIHQHKFLLWIHSHWWWWCNGLSMNSLLASVGSRILASGLQSIFLTARRLLNACKEILQETDFSPPRHPDNWPVLTLKHRWRIALGEAFKKIKLMEFSIKGWSGGKVSWHTPFSIFFGLEMTFLHIYPHWLGRDVETPIFFWNLP